MSEENQVLDVQITLKGKEKERFLQVKRFKGLSDDEVLWLIINEYFEKKLVGNKTLDKLGKR